jgi:hypothetical protein
VKAGFEAGEQEKIESGLKIMEHAEDITSRFNLTIEILNRSEVSARTCFQRQDPTFKSFQDIRHNMKR